MTLGDDDLNVFLDDFSESSKIVFTWETDGQMFSSKSFSAIYDNAFFDASVGETVLDTTAPRLTAKHADVIGIPREAITTIRDIAYSLEQIQPDGTGFATLILARE